MPELPYSTGSITLTAGQPTVVGTGTAWLIYGIDGGILTADGLSESIPVVSVESDAGLTLQWNSPVTLTTANYAIIPYTAEQMRALWANRQLSQMIARAVGVNLARSAVGITLAERDAYDAEKAGFAFVLVQDEPGSDPVLYVKKSDTSGDWTPNKPWRGPPGTGATGPVGPEGPTGPIGLTGATGAQGDKGWSPIFAGVADGLRIVHQLVDYSGGAGTKPTANIGQYVAVAGYTSNIALAVDFRGAAGTISGVTPWWQSRITVDATRRAARAGLAAADDLEGVVSSALAALDLRLTDPAAINPAWLTRASTGYYFDNVGAFRSAGVNEPRFTFDPVTKFPRGLLLEPATTNLLIHCDAYDNAAWTKAKATISANTSIALDGTSTADRLIEDNTAGEHNIFRSVAVAALTAHTLSFYVRRGDRSAVRIQMDDGVGNVFARGDFDLIAGTVGNIAGTARIEQIGSAAGWYRCSVSGVSTAAATARCWLWMMTGGTVSYTGNSTGFVQLGASQLEPHAEATSLVLTGAATASRAEDFFSIPLGSWYNPAEGTVFVEAAVDLIRPQGNADQLVRFWDGTVNNRVDLRMRMSGADNVANLLVLNAGATQVDTTDKLIVRRQVHRWALAYKQNDFGFTQDATTVLTDAAGQTPTANTLAVLNAGSIFLITRLVYWPFRLPNSELLLLTP